ncbi:hypothetical protein JW710_00635 [Candidatus Dojkabacteria bacterium]|nr:hypothetical protein [Candidatus Dojkabacteria bacterium]
MNKKLLIILGSIGAVLALLTVEFFLVREYACETNEDEEEEESQEEATETEGLMILIEYKDTVGLTNFVNELAKRDIPSALLATPEFVQENCDTIKKLMEYDMEIIGSHTEEALWDIPYDEQYEIISEIKTDIEACTGEPLKIVGSRFMASDENTAKVADKLGIPYVTARGTTGTKASVYDPEDYDVKLLSISNIETVEFKYGSLCDYSYWTREGEPSDMEKDLADAVKRYDKVTPVSHTNIGGYIQSWLDMWIKFWDSNEDIEWLTLDEMMENTDYKMPYYKIPQNHNAPYTPQMLEHVESDEHVDEDVVDNPCAVEDLP